MDNQSISTQKSHLTPLDFFLYAGLVAALITVVVSFINLTFSTLERLFPDPLNSYYTASSGMQSALAFLIIAFPVLIALVVIIRRSINKDVSKANLGLRKWVLYGILFISGLIFLGDIITLVRYFLMGDLGALFVSKILIVLLTSFVLFVYFLHELTYENVWSKKSITVFNYVSIVLVLAAIVFGFIMMGSPKMQRSIRFDDQRTSDLQSIQWQIVNYYQQFGKLPANLEDMRDPISSSTLPVDPDTANGHQYEYSLGKGKYEFSLCANFNLSTDEANKYKDANGGMVSYPSLGDSVSISSEKMPLDLTINNWAHTAGKYCFNRTIDPVRYPIYKAQ